MRSADDHDAVLQIVERQRPTMRIAISEYGLVKNRLLALQHLSLFFVNRFLGNENDLGKSVIYLFYRLRPLGIESDLSTFCSLATDAPAACGLRFQGLGVGGLDLGLGFRVLGFRV